MSQQAFGAVAPPPVDRLVTGALVGIEQRKGGFVRFTIAEPGREFPTTADTKQPEMISQAQSLMGQVVTVEIRDLQSTNINPHTGQPFMNHYLNKIAPGAGTLAAPAPQNEVQAFSVPAQQTFVQQATAQPQQQAFPSAGEQTRELRIMRIAASKNAVTMHEAMLASGMLSDDAKNIEALVELSEAWVAYFTYGAARFGVQAYDHAPVHNATADSDDERALAAQVGGGVGDGYRGSSSGFADVHTGSAPCPGCGAAPGEKHADDCVPFE